MTDRETQYRGILDRTAATIKARCLAARALVETGACDSLMNRTTEQKRDALAAGQAWVDALAAEIKVDDEADALEAEEAERTGS